MVDADASPAGPSSQPQGNGGAAPVRASKAVSCNECRRLKLRCSKSWPCDMCVKRRLAHLCPDGVQKRERPRGQQAGGSRPASAIDFAMDGADLKDDSPHSTTMSAIYAASNGGGSIVSDPNSSQVAMQSRLESLERKIDLLIARQGGPSSTGYQTPNGSLYDLASIATDPVRLHAHHADATETNRSRGTLSLHADGRSSYVGPHAHSVYLAREDLENGGTSGTRSPAKAAQSRPGSPSPIDLDVAAPRSCLTLDEGVSPLDSNAASSVADAQQQQLIGWTVPGFRSPHSSVAIWNQLRPFLPKRELAQRLVNVYYASLLFMHDIVSKEEMDSEIWPLFYDDDDSERSDRPPPGFHPHKMSLFFAILALGVLLDVKRPQRDPVGRAFYLCSWNALALSNFTESTSTDTIHAIVHAALYLTWRRLSKYAESAWPLFGTMMSMMTRSGLHRDPAHFDMSDAERERRRRVFWDVQGVEVLRSLAFCRPPSILDRHVDTRLPSLWRVMPGQQRPASATERAGAFFALKSYHAQLVNRILDECLCTSSSYALTMQFDARIQRLVRMIPPWLAPEIIPLSKRSEDGVRDMEDAYWDEEVREAMTEEMRHHLIHLNCHQLRLLLHRGWFSQALQQIGKQSDEMLQEQNQKQPHKGPAPPVRFQESVDAVNVCASSIIEIITSAWAHYPALVVRWMFFWNGLFSAAVCRGLYAVKRRRGGGALAAWRDLRAAIQLLRHAVDGWKPLEQPLGILLRLHQRAEKALGDSGVSTSGKSPVLTKTKEEHREGLELLGDEKRRVRFAPKRKSSTPTTPDEPAAKRVIVGGDYRDVAPLTTPQGSASGLLRPNGNGSTNSHLFVDGAAASGSTTPLEFATDVLGQPSLDLMHLAGSADESAGQQLSLDAFNTPTTSFHDAAVRMPAPLPTFALSTEDAQHFQQQHLHHMVQDTPRKDGLLPGAQSEFLTLSSSPGDVPNGVLGQDAGTNNQLALANTDEGSVPSTGALAHSSNAASMDIHHIGPDGKLLAPTPGAPSGADNTAQLMQMLNSGMGWDDVATWDNFIFDL